MALPPCRKGAGEGEAFATGEVRGKGAVAAVPALGRRRVGPYGALSPGGG